MMTMSNPDPLAELEIETHIERVDTKAIAVLARSELESQIDAAHKYPRSVSSFVKEAMGLATLTREVAESCIYALPRGGKVIAGPSVRLAEICASAYGNLHFGSRIIDVEDKEIVAQGVAWDIQKNLRVTVEARRRITDKYGKRYNDDMITVTGAAAGSIALRNALFRVIPRAYVDTIYAKAREVAVGNAQTLAARRVEVVARLQKIGVPVERVIPRVDRKSIDDVTLEDLEVLIGLGTAVKNGERSIDDAFPPIDGTSAKSKALEAELLGPKPVRIDSDGVVHEAQPEPAKRGRKASSDARTTAAQPAAASMPMPEPPSMPPAAADGRDDAAAEAHFAAREREPGEEG